MSSRMEPSPLLPSDDDARIAFVPGGIQVLRNGRVRYYWYRELSGESFRRLLDFIDRGCYQKQAVNELAGKHVFFWSSRRQRGAKSTAEVVLCKARSAPGGER
jgi:hypothetical protein